MTPKTSAPQQGIDANKSRRNCRAIECRVKMTVVMLTRHMVVILALAAIGCGRSEKPEFLIGAAADLRFAMDVMAAQFQQIHPDVAVKTSYGSSGQFTSQIENGAPYDVFCSADAGYPRKLGEEGFAL